jgi:AcrR family transcriptional regulator
MDRRSMIDSDDPRAARTRDRLVAAFHEALAHQDPAQMSVSALARAAGVNRTSFYEHFDSPEDLALHALGRELDSVSIADVARRSRGLPSGQASRVAIGAIVQFVAAQPHLHARLLGPGAAPHLVQAVTERFARDAELALRETPGVPDGVDVAVLSRFLAGGVLGVIGRWLGEGSTTPQEQLVDEIVRCLPAWLADD